MESELEGAERVESNEYEELLSSCMDLLDLNVTDELKSRRYQLELIEQCFKQNSIIFLGTGTGKTYIAVEVIRGFKSQILGNYYHPDTKERTEFKRTFFLVNMVPLAIQQTTYIQTHLGSKFRVKRVIGADMDETWDTERWECEFQQNHVFVVTGEILRKLLVRVTIKMQDINLLIFDEAHHVSKDDIYKQIMDIYHKEQREHGHLRTRIIGLTASLLNEKNMERKLDDKLEKLATIYNSTIITAKNFVEVDEHCARPDFSTIPYTPLILDKRHLSLKYKLENFSNFIEASGGEKWKAISDTSAASKIVTVCGSNHVFQQDQNFEIKSLQCVKKLGNKLQVVVEQLGPRIAFTFAENLKLKLLSYYNDLEVEHIQAAVRCLLSIVSCYLRSWEGSEPKLSDVSNKVTVFCDELKYTSQTEKFCGIAFIKDRVIAHMLNLYLTQLKANEVELSHIKSSHCTGQSPNALFPEVYFDSNSQILLLEKFRKGELNFLLATEVLLEGFNMPQCNLVMTFDKIDHFRFFTQSRGRARAKGGLYKYLVPVDEALVCHNELEKYDKFELFLRKFVLDNFVYIEKEYIEPKNIPSPLTTSTGASITYEQSISYVYQYCQNLVDGVNLDQFTVWAPVFRIYRREEINDNDKFFCVISMPKCCYALTETVTSEIWVASKRAAQRHAALNVCKKLYELNEIDDMLQPKYRLVKLFRQKNKGVSAERLDYRGKKTYDILIPNSVQKHSNTISLEKTARYYLYPIRIIRKRYTNTHTMGILSTNVWNVLPPSFVLRVGLKDVHVEMLEHIENNLTSEKLAMLLNCYEVLIKSMFPLPTKYLDFTSKTDCIKEYIIVPLNSIDYLIDYERVNSILQTIPNEKPKSISPNLEPRQYEGMYVKKNYSPKFENDQYKVVRAGKSTSIDSEFTDEEKAETYRGYFKEKYGVEFTVVDQPFLEVAPYKFVLPSYTRKSSNLEVITKRRNTIILFPEIVDELLLYRNITPDLLLLPSILHKIESFLLVIEFREKLYPDVDAHFLDLSHLYSALTLRRCQEDLDLERLEFLGDTCLKFLTCLSLYCCNITASQALLTLRKSICVSNKQLVDIAVKSEMNLPAYMRGREFVAKNNWLPPRVNPTQEILNKEIVNADNTQISDKMEIACTIDEGNISNTESVKPNEEITDMEIESVITTTSTTTTTTTTTITTTTTDPQSMDTTSKQADTNSINKSNTDDVTKVAPAESSYLRQSLANKSIADSFESIIGSILISGGIPVAMNFLHKYGKNELFLTIEGTPLDLTVPAGMPVKPSDFKDPFHLFLQHGDWLRKIFSYTTPKVEWNSSQRLFYENNHQKDVKLLARDKLKIRIPLTQGHEAILLEALTHDSYNLGTVSLTRSYQRQEFLGDAVLDYLVTTYLMCYAPKSYQPKDLHIMRACVVSNRNFAKLAVDRDIASDLIFSNQHLGKEIKDYSDYILCDSSNQVKFYRQELAYLLEQKRVKSKFKLKEKPVSKLAKAPKALGDVFESTACAVFLISDFNLVTVWECLGDSLRDSIEQFLEAYKSTKVIVKENEIPSASV